MLTPLGAGTGCQGATVNPTIVKYDRDNPDVCAQVASSDYPASPATVDFDEIVLSYTVRTASQCMPAHAESRVRTSLKPFLPVHQFDAGARTLKRFSLAIQCLEDPTPVRVPLLSPAAHVPPPPCSSLPQHTPASLHWPPTVSEGVADRAANGWLQATRVICMGPWLPIVTGTLLPSCSVGSGARSPRACIQMQVAPSTRTRRPILCRSVILVRLVHIALMGASICPCNLGCTQHGGSKNKK